MKLPLPSLLLPLLAPAALADTLLVGEGAPFEEIQDAVLAAAPGDTVRVLPGFHFGDAIMIDKPLTLIGAGSGQTLFRSSCVAIFLNVVPLTIVGLAPGEEVRVVGLTIDENACFGSTVHTTIVSVVDCRGPVLLSDVVADEEPGLLSQALVYVRDSDQVVLDGCRFDSGTSFGPPSLIVMPAPPGLLAISSTVFVNDSSLEGIPGFSYIDPDDILMGPGGPGGPALHAIDSTLFLSRSALTGGAGTSGAVFGVGDPGEGGLAIVAEGSSIHARASVIRGGAGTTSSGGSAPGGSALLLGAGSLVTTTPDVALESGLDGDGGQSAPPIVEQGGVWTALGEERATMALEPNLVAPGGPLGLQLGGAPGALSVRMMSPGQMPAIDLAGIPGPILVNVAVLVIPAPVVLDGQGAASLAFSAPASPLLVGRSFLFQNLVASPAGVLSLSAPAVFGISF